MIDKSLVDILLCPENHSRLRLIKEDALSKLNAAISAGRVRSRRGSLVRQTLQAALLREDRAVLYPIVDGIPVLLIDEGIAVPPGTVA